MLHTLVIVSGLAAQEIWRRPGRELRDGKRFPVTEKETDFKPELLLPGAKAGLKEVERAAEAWAREAIAVDRGEIWYRKK